MHEFWERLWTFLTRCNWRNSTQTTSCNSHFNIVGASFFSIKSKLRQVQVPFKIYFQKCCLFGNYTHIACTNPLVGWKGLLGGELQGGSQTSPFRWEPFGVRIFLSFLFLCFLHLFVCPDTIWRQESLIFPRDCSPKYFYLDSTYAAASPDPMSWSPWEQNSRPNLWAWGV